MITLTPCPAGATPLRPGTAHIAISHARSPRPGWQDQGIPAPHVNAGAAEQGQPGDVFRHSMITRGRRDPFLRGWRDS